MKNLFLFLLFLFLVSSICTTHGQEKVLRPDAPTALNAKYDESDYITPESQTASDEFNGVKFRNIEGIEASFINQSWAGMFQTSSIRPPDSHGAAGPSGIIATVNLRAAYYTKAGVQSWIANMGGAGNFFPSAVTGLSDPRALYDHVSGRFYVMVQENSTTNAYLNLAVSKDNNPSTSTTTEWWFYRFDITHIVGASRYGADYPGFGFDGQAIYVTFNMYILPLSGSPYNHQIITARKDSAIAGTLNYVRRILTPNGSGSAGGFTLQPGTVLSASGPTNKAYFGEIHLSYNDSIRIWALSNPITTPTLTSKTVAVPNHGGFITSAPQLGTATTIATLSPRTQGNAFWYDGALWFCHTAGGGSGRSKVYYYKVNTNNYPVSNPTLAESGAIDGGAGIWRYQPSIGANIFGDVCLVYTESSSSKWPEIRFTTRKATATTWDTPQLLKASLNYSNSDRWGDYASVTQDPTDNTFWVVHEYSRSLGSHDWGTWWGNIIPPTTLGITLIPEGLYNIAPSRLNMRDTVRAYLRSTVSPYSKIDSAKAVIDSLNFTGYFYFANAPSGTYWLSMHHRNTVETWDSGTGTITRGGTILGVDYTTAQGSAYGSNQKLKGTKWCFYSGEVTNNYFIEFDDLLKVYNLYYLGLVVPGYHIEDLTGDGYVEFDDVLLVNNNYINGIYSKNPLNP